MTSVKVVEVIGADTAVHSMTQWLAPGSVVTVGTAISLHGTSGASEFSVEGTGRNDANWNKLVAPYGPLGASFAGYPLTAPGTGRRQFRLMFTKFKTIRRARFWAESNIASHWTFTFGVADLGVEPVMCDHSLFVTDPLSFPNRPANLMPGYFTADPFDVGVTPAPEVIGATAEGVYLSPVVTLDAQATGDAFGSPFGNDEYDLALPFRLRIAWDGESW